MTHSSGLCLDINTCQISKECCIYDIFIHSSSWNQKIVFDFPPLILAVGRRSQLCYLVKLMSKFLCGSFWSSCHLKSLNLRSSCWTESFGHGFRARQVGMFSGCSIQSLWATPASVSVSDKLERAASSGAWKHKLTSTKQSHITVLKKEKEESTFLKFGSTKRPGNCSNTLICCSWDLPEPEHNRGPWSFPTFLQGPAIPPDVHVP